MQNRKKKKPTAKNQHKKVRFEELLEDDRFDEEDYDSVTGDTLEFLSLDDDTIAAYNRSTGSRYAEEDDEDADYEEDEEDEGEADYYEDEEDDEADYYEDEEDYEADYEDEEDDEVDYEDEEDDEADYDDEEDDEVDYEDEEDEDYDDGFAARLMRFIGEMSGLDMAVAVLGILVLVGAVVTGGIYVHAKSTAKQVASFEAVGEEIEGVSVIGESGLLAVSESAKMGNMIDMEEEDPEQQEEKEEEENGEIQVELRLTSIMSDIKIKFVNTKTGKLIGGVAFEVEISGPKSYSLKDDDKDGVIYQTDVAAGNYEVKMLPLSGENAEKYKLPTGSSSVKVTDKIAYEKVDVADEVKSESEINVAKEEATVQNTVEESALKDTVEWVESTKTPIGGADEEFEKVSTEDIVNPWNTTSAFRKMVNPDPRTDLTDPEGGTSGDSTSNDSTSGDSTSNDSTSSDSTSNDSTSSDSTSSDSTSSDSTSNDSTSSDSTSTPSTSTPSTSTPSTSAPSTSTPSTSTPGTGENPGGNTPAPSPDPGASAKPSIKGNTTLEVGKSELFSVAVDNGAHFDVTDWKSDNEKVAKVDSKGMVTAIGSGTARVTVTVKIDTVAGGRTEKLECTVTVQGNYKKVAIIGPNVVGLNQTITLTAQSDPEGAEIIWKSHDDKYATVDEKGVVTGMKEGEVYIRAMCKADVNIYADIKLTVGQAVDGAAKLKDKDGNQLYYKKDDKYIEATYQDYLEHNNFYRKKKDAAYKYTGWQTIDGHLYYFDKDGNYVTGEQVIQGARYTFGSDGRMAKSSGTMGIDVSKHNGNIDWDAVKNSGVSYVIIRCGYRGYSTGVLVEDPKFKSNIKGAKAAGLKVGAYFFSQAVNEVEAVEEASMAIDLVKGYGLNYPLFLDVEGSGGRADGISRDTRTAVCTTFCQTVQNSGIQAGVYANKTWFTEKISTGNLTNYKLWLAQYASAPTYTATRYDLWQYSSKGKVSGISGNVDMNISYVNY